MSSLLARARADIEIAKILLTEEGNPTHDEMITDQAAYHAQQAIENALKYQTEMMGIEYRKTHNIAGLIEPLVNNGFVVPEELKLKAFIISDWEASSRYNDDFSATRADIENAIRIYEDMEKQILDGIKDNSEESMKNGIE